MLEMFLKAAAAGLALAAPIGPMALLCIRRTIDFGWRAGLATGAGIATGDTLLAAVAALGLSSVSRLMIAHEALLHLVAGPVLMYLGLRTIMQRTAPGERSERFDTLPGAYVSSALLTLVNPPTLVAFAALFALIAPSKAPEISTALATIAGIASGSLLWWILLSSGIAVFRGAMTQGFRRMISLVAGTALALFGTEQLLSISWRG